MSNFQTFGAITEGLEGSAPARFTASTTDSLAAMLVAGYLNDKAKIVKANDIIEVNYLDASVFPLNVGEAALYASFGVQYDPILNNWNMIPKLAPAVNISAYGVHSALYTNAGGSATTVLNDSLINPNSVVIARWKSSANAVSVETVLPGNGILTVLSTSDPGASVLEYISVLPSIALQNAGVYAAQYSYAGGGTSIVISNPAITASMVVNANFLSQANASKIATVIASAGAITIVCNTNPGASIIEYVAALPSSALTALGFYAAQYSNAGGSATTTITDATITAASIVSADWASQANAVYIEKVTATASTLTILSTGDPGASVLNYEATPGAEGALAGVYLVAANNLSDVASASASASNLGLGVANNVAFLNVQAGNSGNAGYLRSYPGTAASGFLELQAANSSGNYAAIIKNASLGQASTWTLADPAGAASNILQAPSALVSGNLVKASGTAGLIVDQGVAMKVGKQVAVAGGAAAQTVTDAFCATTSSVIASWNDTSNAVEIKTVAAGSGSFVVTSTGDPGASHLNYVIYN